ncbi:MAG: putative porin [Candidatus Auribacterota bacterium]|nr:putative porin [Candidatus Auribacterota bacterium]
MKKMVYCFTICMAILLLSSPTLVHAQKDVSDLKETVIKQSEMIDMLMGKVKALEEKKYTDVGAMPSSLEQIAPKAAWAERMKIKGDFRYRHEIIDAEGRRHNTTQAERDSRATVRNRQRIRARVALHAEINEDIDFIFQLATGSASPTGTNQTLDTFFESKNVYVDLAYVIWHPEEFFSVNTKGFEMYAGKMKNPFYSTADSEMIWDADVRPEGIAGTYTTKINCVELVGTVGGFWVDEQERDVDVNLWGIQGYFKAPVITDGVKLVGGMTYYDYGAIQDHPIYTASGNSTHLKVLDPAVRYQLDYQILEGFTELHWDMFEMPWVVYGQFVGNMSTKDDDNGFQFGVKLNKCKKPGSWEFQYFYRRLEADAVLGALNDADFGGGGTDNKGHGLKAGYQLSKNTRLNSALLLARSGLEDYARKDHTVFQIDLNFKF